MANNQSQNTEKSTPSGYTSNYTGKQIDTLLAKVYAAINSTIKENEDIATLNDVYSRSKIIVENNGSYPTDQNTGCIIYIGNSEPSDAPLGSIWIKLV